MSERPVRGVFVEHGSYGALFPMIEDIGGLFVPRRFLDEPSVGEELITFMLLHEAHHRMAPSAAEIDHDHWAATQGLPTFFGQRWTPDLATAYVEKVVCQLEGYYKAVYAPSVLEASHAHGGAVYAALPCRVAAIRCGAFEPGSLSTCTAATIELTEEHFLRASNALNGCNEGCAGCEWDFSPVFSGTGQPCTHCEPYLGTIERLLKCPGPYAFCIQPSVLIREHLKKHIKGGKRMVNQAEREVKLARKLANRLMKE